MMHRPDIRLPLSVLYLDGIDPECIRESLVVDDLVIGSMITNGRYVCRLKSIDNDRIEIGGESWSTFVPARLIESWNYYEGR